jgi:hypothetical protein
VYLEALPSKTRVSVLKVRGRLMGSVPIFKKFQALILHQLPLDLMKTLEAVIWGGSVVRLYFKGGAKESAVDREEEVRQITQLGRLLFS